MTRRVVLFSGGLDSTVLLTQAKRDGEPTALSVNYGQRHKKELEHAKAITKLLSVEHVVLDLSKVAEVFKRGALTGGEPVPHGHFEAPEQKATVVPNRNLTLISVAAALAITKGCTEVWIGAHAGDREIYPDCRPVFIEAAQRVLECADFKPLALIAPFLTMNKVGIVTRGVELNAPMALSWSCYEGKLMHCGKCGACQERQFAFKAAHVPDETEYV